MNVRIDDMTLFDLNSISDILQIDFDDFWNLHIFESELRNTNSSYIAAKIENEIVGFAGFLRAVDDVHITNIVTKKEKRNLGIGSLLLENLIDRIKKENFKAVTLEVNENNLSAIQLYEKYHFQKVGFRKNYYKGENAIIMTLEL